MKRKLEGVAMLQKNKDVKLEKLQETAKFTTEHYFHLNLIGNTSAARKWCNNVQALITLTCIYGIFLFFFFSLRFFFRLSKNSGYSLSQKKKRLAQEEEILKMPTTAKTGNMHHTPVSVAMSVTMYNLLL